MFDFLNVVFCSFQEIMGKQRNIEIIMDKKKLIFLIEYYFTNIIPFIHTHLFNTESQPIADRHKVIAAKILCIMLYLPIKISGNDSLEQQKVVNAEFVRYLSAYILKLPWKNSEGRKISTSTPCLTKLWPEHIRYLYNICKYLKNKARTYSSGYLELRDAGYVYVSIFSISQLWYMIECHGVLKPSSSHDADRHETHSSSGR